MKSCKVFVPFGALGTGIDEEAFNKGISLKPDIISTDAGSTDSGPFYLGTGKCKYARNAIKRDLTMMITAAAELKIPITIGSVGTCGTDNAVDEIAEIVDEITKENGLSPKVAKIYTEQDKNVLIDYYKKGKFKELSGAPVINEKTISDCEHIVGLAGIEAFMSALSHGADIVLCGRATDTAVIAAYPIMQGCDVAMSWHAAKTAECGCLCTTNPFNGGVFLTIDEESFVVEGTGKDTSCTPYTVSSHLLYENADPVRLVEPGVIIDTSNSQYEQLPEGKVRVTGTTAVAMPYTMKLEGAAVSGYQTISMVGIRDRSIMKDPFKWIEGLCDFCDKKLQNLGFSKNDYTVDISPYGYNATYGGKVPDGYIPNEILVLLRITAKTQELATQVAKVFNPYLLHYPVFFDKPLPSFAFPFSPAEIERGKLFEFKLYHVVNLETPNELIRFDYNF